MNCPKCNEDIMSMSVHYCNSKPTNRTMNDTPTPRTDANDLGWQFHEQYDYFDSLSDDPIRWVDFARILERELTAAREELAELKEEYGTWWAQKRIAIDELKEVTEQRDRLAEALQQIIIEEESRNREHAFNATTAREALQSLKQDHTVDANDMIAAVKGGSDE